MKTIPRRKSVIQWAAVLAAALTATVVSATPYATCLTNQPVGTLSFRLNEPANAVRIIYNGGANSTNLGSLPKGLTVTNLGITGTFSVEVTHNGGKGWLQGITNGVSSDANILMRFVNQRGVVVNKNPASPYFGRIYVAHGAQGTNAASGRVVKPGIYVINPDQTDALGQQIDTTNTVARTGGLVFNGTEGPHRLFIGPDDSLYIADWSDAQGSLYTTDPNVGTNAFAVDVLGGPTGSPFPVGATRSHGSINASYVTGSLGTSDLTVYVIDEDLQNNKTTATATMRNSIWKWEINAGPLPATAVTPTPLVTLNGIPTFGGIGGVSDLSDFTIGPMGQIYHCQIRADNASTDCVIVRPANGSAPLWSSLAASRAVQGNNAAFDILGNSQAVDISPDGIQAKFLAVLKQNTNAINFLPLDPNNGIPDITNRITVGTLPTTGNGRDLGFDAAGNIYSVSSGQGLLRIYSPGGTTVATTSSDGAFTITNLLPGVTLSASQSSIPEDGTSANFTVTRTGDNTSPLTVYLATLGTAINGVDHTSLPPSVVIPANQSSVDIPVASIGDALSEPTESIFLSIVDNTNYFILGRNSVIFIADTNTPVFSVTSITASMYEPITNDYVTLQVSRSAGDTNVTTLFEPGNLTYGGTAVMDVDYVVLTNNFSGFGPGELAKSIKFASPLNDNLLKGNRTLIVGTTAGVDSLGATNTVIATIIEDEDPAGTVLWSDDFNLADYATNYVTRLASTNGIDVYTTDYAYDYAANLSLPPAPHSTADTLGLHLNLNKDGVAGASAMNLYPTNLNVGTNFAFRFDMYLFCATLATTEHAMCGINHTGTQTNWVRGSNFGFTNQTAYDGEWAIIQADASAGTIVGDYQLFTAPRTTNAGVVLATSRALRNASTLTQVYKTPPYSILGGAAGVPANLEFPVFPQEKTWSDVELSQVIYLGSPVITLKLNHSIIFQYTNTLGSSLAASNGTVMLGYLDAYDSASGNSRGVVYDNARVVALDPLRITSQPLSAIIPLGGNTNLTIGTAGTTSGFTSYQWRLNGTNLPGATSSSLSLTSIQLTNYGPYTVVVSDGTFSFTSATATVVPPAPVIITPPASRAVPLGRPVTLSVVASTSTGSTNYQWNQSATNVTGVNFSGATTKDLTIANMQSTNTGPYTVRVSDGFTTTISSAATLTIASQPVITNSLSGGGATFNLTFPTEIGPRYVVEWKGELTNGNWNQLTTNVGTGSAVTVPDTALTSAQRYYRVRME